MFEYQRICEFGNRAGRHGLLGAVLVFSLAAGGCSADISRFDLGKYGVGNDGGATGSLPASNQSLALSDAPVPSEPMAGRGNYDGRIGGSVAGERSGTVASRRAQVEAQRLPDLAPPTRRQSNRFSGNRRALGAQRQTQPRRVAALRRSTDGGATPAGQIITVARGDTLYGLSRRYGVSIAALKSANGLRNSMIRPGQKLQLPGAGVSTQQTAALPRRRSARQAPFNTNRGNAVAARSTRHMRATAGALEAPLAGAGVYTVKSGDSIYRIARQLGLRSADLRAANPGVNPRRIRPGQVLRLPGQGTRVAAQRQAAEPVVQAPRVVNTAAPRTFGKVKTRIINSKTKPKRVASLRAKKRNDAGPIAAPASRSSAAKFRWPVKGRMIAKFGSRSDGTQNDGINILVPKGTAVKAAENGVVAYAGNELKGYGNLILVRHAGNWVTAYAHNSQLNVKRGDKVRRGQVIAKAGTTGTVDQPQLHFELRKGSKPVNPLPYLR